MTSSRSTLLRQSSSAWKAPDRRQVTGCTRSCESSTSRRQKATMLKTYRILRRTWGTCFSIDSSRTSVSQNMAQNAQLCSSRHSEIVSPNFIPKWWSDCAKMLKVPRRRNDVMSVKRSPSWPSKLSRCSRCSVICAQERMKTPKRVRIVYK